MTLLYEFLVNILSFKVPGTKQPPVFILNPSPNQHFKLIYNKLYHYFGIKFRKWQWVVTESLTFYLSDVEVEPHGA